ncbi:hypothetical protein [Pseudomonas sp. nanlin1]|uniref:hypothetical protein n=1 Tax=Pseudomonas sp. nanlin1 TaxID=3040605 RepID=UPI00388E5EE7
MAAVLVGQFHARDAERRVYSVHEFRDADLGADGQPTVTYKLAIGDRVKHKEGDIFVLVQTGVEITREQEHTL